VKKRSKVWLIAFGIVAGLAVGCVVATMLSSWNGEVTIKNDATKEVTKGQISICNQQFDFGGLKVGTSKTIAYRIKSDSHYKVVVEFESGKKLSKELGYVTNGMDFKDVLRVKDDDIILEKKP